MPASHLPTILTDLDVIEKHLDVNLSGSVQSDAGDPATVDTLERSNREQPVPGLGRPLASPARVLYFEGGGVPPDTIAATAPGNAKESVMPFSRAVDTDMTAASTSRRPRRNPLPWASSMDWRRVRKISFLIRRLSPIADGWRTGVAKTFERQYAGFVSQTAAVLQ